MVFVVLLQQVAAALIITAATVAFADIHPVAPTAIVGAILLVAVVFRSIFLVVATLVFMIREELIEAWRRQVMRELIEPPIWRWLAIRHTKVPWRELELSGAIVALSSRVVVTDVWS
ncbi:Os12g0118550 [Oryza sativa Japonica Group]|uniref:Os12g0118550 protein n=1 Tax=Oryza sativa subsp. japonica TaxID=39947 RepID=A0A0P0Y6A4_ORYSJ|nr:Os12g0118550 [Oryza sativa Japonica Group]